MKKLTRNIQVKVGSNKGKVSGNLLIKPKTHKLPRVVKAKAGQTITGKIGGIRKSSNKTTVKPGKTISGKIRRRTNWPENPKRSKKYLSKRSSRE